MYTYKCIELYIINSSPIHKHIIMFELDLFNNRA